MTTTVQDEINLYVFAVRAALGDLPESLRDELLEDLPEHLAEVLADGEGSLQLRPTFAISTLIEVEAGQLDVAVRPVWSVRCRAVQDLPSIVELSGPDVRPSYGEIVSIFALGINGDDLGLNERKPSLTVRKELGGAIKIERLGDQLAGIRNLA